MGARGGWGVKLTKNGHFQIIHIRTPRGLKHTQPKDGASPRTFLKKSSRGRVITRGSDLVIFAPKSSSACVRPDGVELARRVRCQRIGDFELSTNPPSAGRSARGCARGRPRSAAKMVPWRMLKYGCRKITKSSSVCVRHEGVEAEERGRYHWKEGDELSTFLPFLWP